MLTKRLYILFFTLICSLPAIAQPDTADELEKMAGSWVLEQVEMVEEPHIETKQRVFQSRTYTPNQLNGQNLPIQNQIIVKMDIPEVENTEGIILIETNDQIIKNPSIVFNGATFSFKDPHMPDRLYEYNYQYTPDGKLQLTIDNIFYNSAENKPVKGRFTLYLIKK